MKQCPACQSTFDDKVDFCFSDGTPLVAFDAADDPTALPGAADASASESLSDATTQVIPKPKRSKRGMFGRPSVADMLSVPVSASVPPAGGNRVGPGPDADLPKPQPDPTPSSLEESAEIQIPQGGAVEESTVVEAIVDVPELDNEDGVEPGPVEALDAPPPSIEVPVSPAVVELPETGEAEQEPTEAPPGFDAEETALDDSWFGDGIDADPTEDTQPIPEDSVEDPSFADVSEGTSGDDVGFDDSSWSAGGAVKSSAPVPKTLIVGGVMVLAACVMLTVLFSDDDQEPASRVAATESPPKAPPPVEPPPPAPAEEPVEEEPLEEVEAEPDDSVEEPAPVEPVEEEEVDEEPAVPVPVPVPTPTEPSKPASSEPETARKAEAPKASKPSPPEAIPSPWTGAPAAATPAPAASNPWGAPTETPSRGRLTITTEPAGAMIFVDDRRIGKSPTRTEVDYGTHSIRVELADYKGTSRVVNVRASEVSVPFRLESERLIGKCILLGSPGSQVVMNGRNIGAIPVTVDCEPGAHSFKVTPLEGASFNATRSVSFARSGETANVFLTP